MQWYSVGDVGCGGMAEVMIIAVAVVEMMVIADSAVAIGCCCWCCWRFC